MKKAPWFKFFAGEYLDDPDVDDLPLEAQGILPRMWCASWTYGSLPSDVEEIARKCKVRLAPMQMHVQSLLQFFVQQPDGTYISERQERERQRSGIVSKARKKAANAMWSKRLNAHASAKPNANRPANGDANDDAKSMEVRGKRLDDRNQSVEESKIRAVATESGDPLTLRPVEPRNSKRANPKSEDLALPDWVPARQWAEFVEMRVLIKKPMTSGARKYAVTKLTKLRSEGQDISAVLEQSVFRDWPGLYPVASDKSTAAEISTAPPKGKPEPALVAWEAPENLNVRAGVKIWTAALEALSTTVDPHSFSAFFKPTRAAGVGDGVLFVITPTPDFCDVLRQEKYATAVAKVVNNLKVQFTPAYRKAAA